MLSGIRFAPGRLAVVHAEVKQNADVVVIGGGVAGLAAAGELGRRGLRVVIIEARDRLGGRIWTARPPRWPHPVELGAEFIHGGNEDLWRLLRRHRLRTRRVPSRHWWLGATGVGLIDATSRIAAVTKRIGKRRMRGWSFAKFLAAEGSAIEQIDRDLAVGFVEGFEAAPMAEMSATAIAGETLEDDEQHTLPVGYDTLVLAMMSELENEWVSVSCNAICRGIRWRPGEVQVDTSRGRVEASRAVITLPLGVLQAKVSERGAIEFVPRLREHSAVVAKMRMGHVLRLNLRLDGRSWRSLMPESVLGATQHGLGFVHTGGDEFPVWWSLSDPTAFTGWTGGPRAIPLIGSTTRGVRRVAIESLARLLRVPVARLSSAVLGVVMHDWSRDPFSRGAYSFTRAGQEDAAARLRQPVRNTLFFAGEATADGEETGTVHGALASGLRAAKEVSSILK